jgi:hypothetical protein
MGGDIFHDGFSGPTDTWRGDGAVWVETPGDNTIINYTYPNHIFHEGNIVQTITQHWYGSTITVNGQGENSTPWVAAMNQYGGPVAFQITDNQMFVYATQDQLSGGLLVTLTDMIP